MEHVNTLRPSTHHDVALDICRKRGRGYPLQYLLGSQPFGNLDIICRKGVLIPRPETETYTAHLADLIKKEKDFPQNLRILDLCTGTGAISLMLYNLLVHTYRDLEVMGVDFSDVALKLAKQNIERNRRLFPSNAPDQIVFKKCDILQQHYTRELSVIEKSKWDIIISNPPYISARSYWKDTSRSARLFEPMSALAPPDQVPDHLDMTHLQPEDMFYSAIVAAARNLSTRYLLMEVADLQQAMRVVKHTRHIQHFGIIEIWRDWPMDNHVTDVSESNSFYTIRGSGHGRSVLCKL